MQPVLKSMGYFNEENYENAEYISKKGFYLPSGLGLSDDDIGTVVQKLKKVLQMVSI